MYYRYKYKYGYNNQDFHTNRAGNIHLHTNRAGNVYLRNTNNYERLKNTHMHTLIKIYIPIELVIYLTNTASYERVI